MPGKADARARAALLAAFSHDLRAPLARIIQYQHMLGASPGAEVRRYQAAIETCARQQLELIDDLLDYARLELAEPELVVAPVFLYALLQQAGAEGEALAAAQGGSFALQCEGALPALALFDARRLRQILRKLLEHGARVSQRGHFSLRGEALAAPRPGAVVLRFSVNDSGAGIAAADMADLFRPFAAPTTGHAGALLGLALAERLVRAMGGRLQAGNLAAGGSTFGFALEVDAARECDAMTPAMDGEAPPPCGAGWRLLLLEADTGSADYLSELLACAEFDVERAASLEQALALQRDPGRRCHLVLAADNVPGLDPWPLLRALSAGSGAAPLLLYALLPPRRPPDWPDSLDFSAVLYKPAAPADLLAALQRLLASAHAGA